jgi:REP element-mobilizing transposase RayT
MDKPFALHITWTCYGTWLPGDRRGYVSNTLLPPGGFLPKQNVPGTPCTADDPYTQSRARALQKDTTAQLTTELAEVAARALVAAAAKREWRIVRGALMANHVHVVVMNCPADGEGVRRVLKGNSQAAVSDHVGQSHRWWTSGGSDRYKNDDQAIAAAIRYVAEQPGKLVEIVDMAVHVIT